MKKKNYLIIKTAEFKFTTPDEYGNAMLDICSLLAKNI
jgi:hypothetical protein